MTRPPGYLFRNDAEWRTWVEKFPVLEHGGYVPAGRFLRDLQAHLETCPTSGLSKDNADDLSKWFASLLKQSERDCRENKPKLIVGYVASASAVIADIAFLGDGISLTVASASAITGSTTAALDLANGWRRKQLDTAEDTFDEWLATKRI